VYAIVAWRLLYLSRLGRAHPDLPASRVLAPAELAAVRALCRGKTGKAVPDQTLGALVRAIAQLGGFLGRRSDGEPGVETLWRGLAKVFTVVQALLGWQDEDSPAEDGTERYV
jgi:hypothetical protein